MKTMLKIGLVTFLLCGAVLAIAPTVSAQDTCVGTQSTVQVCNDGRLPNCTYFWALGEPRPELNECTT